MASGEEVLAGFGQTNGEGSNPHSGENLPSKRAPRGRRGNVVHDAGVGRVVLTSQLVGVDPCVAGVGDVGSQRVRVCCWQCLTPSTLCQSYVLSVGVCVGRWRNWRRQRWHDAVGNDDGVVKLLRGCCCEIGRAHV